jgi:hypothetical protein
MPGTDDDSFREDREYFQAQSPGSRFISYTVPASKETEGIAVQYVIKIATGKRAKEIDARQAKVIMEILQWCRQDQEQQEQAKKEQQAPPGTGA